MTSKSMPWTTNNTGDGPTAGYATDRWQEMLRTLSVTDPTLYYVAANRLNEYAVSGSSSPVTVQSGEGFVNGRHVLDDASQTVAVPTPTVSTRIDRIILRSDGTAQTVRVTRLAGVEGGSAPTLTQNSTTYEVSLARVSITTGGVITVTDERGWLGIRGLVDATTIEWDSSGKKIRVKDGGISAAKLASDAVTTAKILDANVTTAKLADNAVTTAKITDANVTAAKLASDAVTTAKILDANVTNAKLASGIDGSKITTGSPTVTGLTNSGSMSVTGNVNVVGQLQSTKSGAGLNSGVLVTSSQPSIALNETDQAADEKRWDFIATGKVFAIRAINDAESGASSFILVQRGSGINITSLTLDAPVTITGALTANGALNFPAGSIGSSPLATGAVTTTKIADANVTDAKIASGINGAKISAGSLHGDAIVDATVSTAKLANSAITTAKIADANVTTVKIADANVTTAKIADANVTTAKLALNSVDDTIVGDRVPQFYRRQGGSASNWNAAGTTNYTPSGGIRMQGGVVNVSQALTLVAGSVYGFTATITFPQAYSAIPNCIANHINGNVAALGGCLISVNVYSVSTTALTILVQVFSPGSTGAYTINADLSWFATGPE